MPPSLLARVLPLLLAALPLACINRGTHVTAAEQESFGTHTFAADYDATFVAARDALPLLGYDLDFASAPQGRITTTKRHYGERAGVEFGGTVTSELYRQYDLRLVRVDAGHTRVIATPRKYNGDRDMSANPVWTMTGPEGEYEQWRALFAQIEHNLRAP
ncbi:hypothetical protein [Nannocystis radixulma]|uniref:DUF4136 domain-containing protein n=1 Tax=Nannocystis radixulma TaxID=2995305 RepID=A0ABT5BNN5_9BACT|nr:hypothetical protein [Nannocystis radixulma]MDC0675780.1 hypothetical protein [Nannocystis radixulma]